MTLQYLTPKGFNPHEAARIYAPAGKQKEATAAALGTADGLCVRPVQHGSSEGGLRRRWALRRLSAALLPGWRVGRCGQSPIKGKTVTITRNGEGKHGVSNVRVCGSVWVCPDCAAKIAARRAFEIQEAIDAHHAAGGEVLMLALTIQHDYGDKLADLVTGLAAAQSRLWSGRAAAALREKYGILGLIRNAETTWGTVSGWHPHAHVLLFTRKLSAAERVHLIDRLAERWQVAAEQAGMYASLEHGLHGQGVRSVQERVQERAGDLAEGIEQAAARGDTRKVADYMAKLGQVEELVRGEWGAPHELTWQHIKQARGMRWTPWALLQAAGNDRDEWRAAALWQEFAEAYKGRAQLRWSRGLRDALGLGGTLTDEEAAVIVDETAVEVGEVHGREWGRLVRTGRAEQLLAFLDHFAIGAADVQSLISGWLQANSHPGFT